MNDLQAINAALAVFCAGALSVIVLRTDIREGPILKVGLVGMIFANLITAMLIFEGSTNWDAYSIVSIMNRISIAVVCVGFIGRAVSYANKVKPHRSHSHRTNQILRGITEPLNDVAFFFQESEPAQLEKKK